MPDEQPNFNELMAEAFQAGILVWLVTLGYSSLIKSQHTPATLPPVKTELKGRASSSIRPGIMIREVLMRERPIYGGAYVSEASTADLYRTYIELLNQENKLRDKRHKLKGPTLHSFDTHFRFAEYLGLVEKAGYMQEKGGMKRTTYRITQEGIADDKSWDNLCGAWKEIRNKVVFRLPRSMVHGET